MIIGRRHPDARDTSGQHKAVQRLYHAVLSENYKRIRAPRPSDERPHIGARIKPQLPRLVAGGRPLDSHRSSPQAFGRNTRGGG